MSTPKHIGQWWVILGGANPTVERMARAFTTQEDATNAFDLTARAFAGPRSTWVALRRPDGTVDNVVHLSREQQ